MQRSGAPMKRSVCWKAQSNGARVSSLIASQNMSESKQEERFVQIAKQAKANLAPVPAAKTFALLPATAEGIAYDPVSRRLFVGPEGQILQIDEAGKVSPFASGNGLRQVLGIKVDPERRLLWAVSGRFPDVAPGPKPAA
jgi:hypothetical protein